MSVKGSIKLDRMSLNQIFPDFLLLGICEVICYALKKNGCDYMVCIHQSSVKC